MNYYKQMDDYIIKRFENPDEVREFDKGKYEVVNLPHMTIGKATYHKGWKWSDDVSPLSGTEFCETEHLGMVISGNATVAFENEEPKVIGPGDISTYQIHPTTVGLLEMKTMYPFILWVQKNMLINHKSK